MKNEIEARYFFVKLALANEPITEATRFTYFLVMAWGNPNTYEIEMNANNKARIISSLLSRRHNVNYKVVHVDTIADPTYNILKTYFPHFDYKGKTLITYDTSRDSGNEEGA
jgi:hypothetical protein